LSSIRTCRAHSEIPIIHQSRIESVVEVNREIYGKPEGLRITEEEKKIGELIAENLVEDGSTLQLGIGAIPDSTLLAMKNHKDLGIHTELLSDGVMDLIEKGVINNSRKSVLPGKAVTSFAFGTQKFYKFLDNNPLIHFDCCSWTNDEGVIQANSKMTCINSGIEVDITGQVVADSIGEMFYSGFGGQVQFINAAATAHDGKGKAIIAMTSRTNKGKSKITTTLTEGSGVVTTRGHIRYVVTEHGIASLGGKNVRQRAHALIRIAHPDARERLEKEAFERLKCMPSP
ncbi:butyryl-CoA:acetate CoA-transferase domain protein, partial [Oesophagostomum dentatum]